VDGAEGPGQASSGPAAQIPLSKEEVSVQQFETTAEIISGVRVVTVRGELDIATSPQVRELLSGAATDRARPLVIDLVECEFIDSTGLAALLHGAKPAQNGQSHVAIVSPGGDVRRMLELTAIDKTIPVFETLDQAVTAVLAVGR
jgi:anti-sigma B factor antagonist